MKRIELTKGKFTIVDDDDYEVLSVYKWCCNGRGYAARSLPRINGKQSMVSMHRQIMNFPEGLYIDHINGDKLDNRKCNLRVCTNSENQRNRGVPINNTTGFKGVGFQYGKYNARIKLFGKLMHIGVYSTAEEAHQAYCEASVKLHGEFAKKKQS